MRYPGWIRMCKCHRIFLPEQKEPPNFLDISKLPMTETCLISSVLVILDPPITYHWYILHDLASQQWSTTLISYSKNLWTPYWLQLSGRPCIALIIVTIVCKTFKIPHFSFSIWSAEFSQSLRCLQNILDRILLNSTDQKSYGTIKLTFGMGTRLALAWSRQSFGSRLFC